MRGGINADNIMTDYYKKKRYEDNKRRTKINEFKKKNCIDCENRNTNLCHIQINIKNELQCVYKK